MSRSHHKRLVMPRTWPLTRKTDIWAQKPNPSGHPLEMCMPLGIILRDVLGVAHNMREPKRILHSRQVMVDGEILQLALRLLVVIPGAIQVLR